MWSRAAISDKPGRGLKTLAVTHNVMHVIFDLFYAVSVKNAIWKLVS